MMRYGLYYKGHNESAQHINLVEIGSLMQAEAYFAGVKQLSIEQFRELFIVKEIRNSSKTLIYANK